MLSWSGNQNLFVDALDRLFGEITVDSLSNIYVPDSHEIVKTAQDNFKNLTSDARAFRASIVLDTRA